MKEFMETVYRVGMALVVGMVCASKYLYIFYLTERICKNCVDVVVMQKFKQGNDVASVVSCAKCQNCFTDELSTVRKERGAVVCP